jgi:hypothetical protein
MRMASESSSYSSYAAHPSLRSRATAFLLALAAALLIVWLLVRLGLIPAPLRQGQSAQSTLHLLPGTRIAAKKAESAASHAHRSLTPPKPAAPATPPPIKTPPPPPIPWNVIPLSHDEMAQADISNKPTRSAQTAASGATSGTDSGQDSASAYGPGAGPGGEQLYDVEWYQRPTDAQLSFYLPPGGVSSGWGEVACRTVAHYHVDDCQEIGETPGSGLARAVRQAAWQFLVLPPRVGHHPLIGGWVRIRIDYGVKGEASAR